MEVLELEACAVELAAPSDPTPITDAATRLVRQARATQLDEIRDVVDSGAYFTEGHRSPAAWLREATRESYGHCTQTISLAKRIIEMPVVHPRRLVSDIQFDLLVTRDHGCQWRGCNIPAAGCDAHHADHRLDGGETEPDNLILLCW